MMAGRHGCGKAGYQLRGRLSAGLYRAALTIRREGRNCRRQSCGRHRSIRRRLRAASSMSRNHEMVRVSLPTNFQLSGDQGHRGRLRGTLNQEPFQSARFTEQRRLVCALQNWPPRCQMRGCRARSPDHQQARPARCRAARSNVARAEQAAQQAFERAGGRSERELSRTCESGRLRRVDARPVEGCKAATKAAGIRPCGKRST